MFHHELLSWDSMDVSRRSFACSLAALPFFASLPSVPSAGVQDGEEDPAPGPEPLPENGAWLNLVGQTPTVESLRGQAVCLVFFSGVSSGVNWGQIRSFWHEFEGRGLAMIGVWTSSFQAAQQMLEQYNVHFPIGVQTSFPEFFGVPGSQQILLDKSGKIFWSGPVGGLWKGKLLKGMRGAKHVSRDTQPLRLHVPGDFDGRIGRVQEKCFDGKLASALKDLDYTLEDKRTTPEDLALAQTFRTHIETHVDRCLRQIESEIAFGEARRAMIALESIVKELKNFTLCEIAVERLSELQEDEEFQRVLEADEAFEDAYGAFWQRGLTKNKTRLEKLLSDFPGTRGAQKARNLLQSR